MTKYLKTKEGSIEDLAKQMQNKVLESDYQDKFKKALDKEGKPLGHMTGAEKKSFFNKVDKMHKGQNEKFEPHMMYDPKTGEGTKANKEADHLKMKKMGYTHDKPKDVKEARYRVSGTMGYRGIGGTDGFEMVINANSEKDAENKAEKELDKARSKRQIGPGGGGSIEDLEIEGAEKTNDPLESPSHFRLSHFDPSMKTESVNETHTTQTAKANKQQRDAGGEKSPISLMKNKSIDEITANNGKTFAQMRAEIDEACWDSHKQVGTKMKGGKQVPNCVPKNEANEADKGKKEQESGEDTRDKKQKTMSGQIATSPEMNPKVDYKY